MAIAQRTDWIINDADDVTGDGYADLIVGMPNGTAYNGSFASYVEIFHGSLSGFGSAPNQSKQLAGLGFGTSVTYTDEVTNDSICDLAIGSPQENSLTGKAYVYAGGTSIFSASPVRTYTGENAGDQFGYCVAAAGRYSTLRTLVIGAPYVDFPTFGYSNCGACYFYSSTGAGGYPSTRDNKIYDLSGGNDANLGWSLTVFPDWSDGNSNCVGMGAPGCNTSTYSHLGSVLVLDVTP